MIIIVIFCTAKMVKMNRSTSRIINIKDSVTYKERTNCTKSTKKEKISKMFM